MLSPGTRLGRFEVLSPLGAGGMGEVYKARDLRLSRNVALKVLPHLKASPEFRERLEREARAIANLNHPHICTLHDVLHESGLDLLVVEYCEGETLEARLQRGPLPLDQALRVAAEVAEALDHAHRHGFTHRDLKPGNIMLTPAGAKLLDFGLAKLRGEEELDLDHHSVGTAPTETFSLTSAGVAVGTRQYMAPEQLDAKPVDDRTDIFAFGAVLYEMVTGRRAFEGENSIRLIAAILTAEPPPASTLQPAVPPSLDRLLKNCLAKNPDDRWSSMHDVLLELRGIAEGLSSGMPEVVAQPAKRRAAAGWAIAALLLLATLAAWAVPYLRRPSAAGPIIRFSMSAPETAAWAPLDRVAVSPDGRRFAFVASLTDRKPLLWVRLLDSVSAQPLSGTEGAYHPFWSPDSRFIGFFAQGKLKTIEVSGGPPQVVCDAPFGRSATWNATGDIVFARSARDPLYSVSATGGIPAPVTVLDQARGEWAHRSPHFLPDGRHFLYLVRSTQPGRQGVYVGSIDGSDGTRVLSVDSEAAFAAPGYLLYLDGASLTARKFDPERFQVIGEPFPIAHPVGHDVSTDRAFFSVSGAGVLTYRSMGDPNMQLAWFDRSGKEMGRLDPPGQYWDLSLSPDDKRLAVTRMDALLSMRDIWVFELSSGTASPLTFHPANDFLPIWSPDGTRIIFTSPRDEKFSNLYQKPSSGAGDEERLVRSASEMWATDWSRDGQFVVLSDINPSRSSRSDLWVMSTADRQVKPWLGTPFRETQAQFSPDGRWIAYSSDESGRPEVYVQSFPAPGTKWPVSTSGGAYPKWRRDGQELFYLDPEGNLRTVGVTLAPSFRVTTPRVLFQTGLTKLSSSGAGVDYAITGDGQRVLLKTPLQSADASPITVVVNWTAALK